MHSLSQQIDRRNADKWRAVPFYIEYLLSQFDEVLPRAVCMDIDSTILHENTGRIMAHCLDTFHYLQAKKIAVFLITARSKHMHIETTDELQKEGITTSLYRELLMDNNNGSDHERLKASHRAYIRKKHSLVLAIGDRIHDLIRDNESDVAYYNILLESLRQY